MNTMVAGYEKRTSLKKSFLITLTFFVVSGIFPIFGAKVSQASVTEVVQVVAGTGESGNLKSSKAAWSQMSTPKDIEVIEPKGPDGEHLLLLNDPSNKETWLTVGNSLNTIGTFSPGADYAAIQFRTANGDLITPQDFVHSPMSNDEFNSGIYFTGYAKGSVVPELFTVKNAEFNMQNSSGVMLEVQADSVMNSNPLASSVGLALTITNSLYTYDSASNTGFKIQPTIDGSLPFNVEPVSYMGAIMGTPVEDIAIQGNFMYMLYDSGWIYRIDMTTEGGDWIILNDLNQPKALDVDEYGYVYIADTGNNRIVRFHLSNPYDLYQVAGQEKNPGRGDEGGVAEQTALNAPEGIAVSEDGTVYISDTGNSRVLQIAPAQEPATAVMGEAGNGTVTLSWNESSEALYYDVYKYAGISAPSSQKSWEYAGSTTNVALGSTAQTSFQVNGLTNGQPYVFAVKAKGLRSTSVFAVSPKLTPVGPPTTTPTNPTNPTNPPIPSAGGGTSTPVATPPAPAPTNTTTINVNVQSSAAANGSVVASLAITRTTGADGTVKDALQLAPAKATEIIELLKPSGSKTAAIVLPDANDAVSQWDFTVPAAASKLLTDQGIELVVLNPNVRIQVPASSLTGLTDDLYFRLIPVKSMATSSEIQSRALADQEIVTAANGGDITVIGRPMTIETNLQSRPVTLTLPLPIGSSFTAAQQKKLGVYIEHSDGTKQLVRGKVVTLDSGRQGLEISVNKFSTFTIVNVSSWGSTLIASPYIMGYANGSFKPAQNITRAELAAIVGRITGVTEGASAFSDVKNGSWASTVVGPAAASGIMTGYSDGTFKPNASITRGELASALSKLLPQSGLDASIQAAGFSDLAASHWAAAPAAQLQAAGVVTGYADGSFKPEQNVTRAEAVTMINRLIGLDGSMSVPGAASWNDVADTYWAYDAVRAASMQR